MDIAQVEALRAVLAPSGWLERARHFARALRSQASTPHGLLIVGTPDDEPWHMAAHLADESRLAGLPGLFPTLLRWAPPQDAPPHLRVGVDRLERAGKAETVLVVSGELAPARLLERVADARKTGAAVFSIDRGDSELTGLAVEALSVRPGQDPVSFDGAQHLVSAAIAEPADLAGRRGQDWQGLLADVPAGSRPPPEGRVRGMRAQLARLLDAISGPQP